MNMRKSIIVGLAMVAVVKAAIGGMVADNCLLNTSNCIQTSNFAFVHSYTVLTTNYLPREYKTIGSKPSYGCKQIGCLVYHCEPILSDTDYFEIVMVNKKTMLKYEVDGIKGDVCIKDEVVSKRKREVKQITSMMTNDWEEVKEVSWENIMNYFSITNNIIVTATTSNYVNEAGNAIEIRASGTNVYLKSKGVD